MLSRRQLALPFLQPLLCLEERLPRGCQTCLHATEHGTDKSSCPLDNRRCHCRSRELFKLRAKLEYQRRRKTRAPPAGARQWNIELLSAGSATAISEDVPQQTDSEDRGGSVIQRCEHVLVSREVWGLQGKGRQWNADVDACALCGRRCKRRPSTDERAFGSSDSLPGAICAGRRMDSRLCPLASGGAAASCLLRKASECLSFGSAIQPSSSFKLGGGCIELPQGDGAHYDQKAGDEREACSSCSQVRRPFESHSSQEAKDPQEAKGDSGVAEGGLSACASVEEADRSETACLLLPGLFNGNKNHKPSCDLSASFSADKSLGFAPPRGGVPNSRSIINKHVELPDEGGDLKVSEEAPVESFTPSNTGARCRELKETALTYPKWCAELTSQVLKSRTPCAAYLKLSIQQSRSSRLRTVAPTFFPIPLPKFGVFGRMPKSSSVDSQHNRHLSRALHVIVSALNFWYLGGRYGDIELLRREPNAQHLLLFDRVRLLIRSEEFAFVPNLPKPTQSR